MRYDSSITVNGRKISIDAPTYFIADLAANHDGDLQRAKDLIWMAREAGADAVKFQHFKASKIVSDYGFRHLGGKLSHQAGWKKSVFEIYQQFECDRSWSDELVKTAREAEIDFMTTPYDIEAIDLLDPYLPAYKIGSGDIVWPEIIDRVAQCGKPVMLATGASSMEDVERAVEVVLATNRQLVLMQCNTNYTGSLENFRYINLRVLQCLAIKYPQMLLGLSDHTPGHATVIGAIVLGARVIEKHFTDDKNRIGPDHPFSMDPASWRDMVDRSRELELALGDGVKRIEENEKETVVAQRRCLRLVREMGVGEVLSAGDLEALRPAPADSIAPYRLDEVIGKELTVAKTPGDALYTSDLRSKRC